MKYLFLITGFVFGLVATAEGRLKLEQFERFVQPYCLMLIDKLKG